MFDGLKVQKRIGLGWKSSPSKAAWAIVLHLFTRVPVVSEEVMRYYGKTNPFSDGFCLSKQVVAQLGVAAGSSNDPIIWRTQPSNQTRYVIALEVTIPVAHLHGSLRESEIIFETPDQSCTDTSLCRHEIFGSMLKGPTGDTSESLLMRWQWQLDQVVKGASSSEKIELDKRLTVKVPSRTNALYTLAQLIRAYHVKNGPDVYALDKTRRYDTWDTTGQHIFSVVYCDEKRFLDFFKQYDRKRDRAPGHTSSIQVATESRPADTTPASHFYSCIKPTDQLALAIWNIQRAECQRLLRTLHSAEMHIGKELLKATTTKSCILTADHGLGTLPLYIVDRYGIWCPEFTTLLHQVHDVYASIVLRYQAASSAVAKASLRRAGHNFILVFSLNKVICGPTYFDVKDDGPQKKKARQV
jgi:hypothetical protein